MSDDFTIGEIARSVRRIEDTMDRIEPVINRHETEIAVLQQNRSTALWALSGIWTLVVAGIEWVLHGKSH
jgi:hypothetical protein